MDREYLDILLVFVTSFCTTYLAIPKIMHFSNMFRLYDSVGKRSSHKGSIPIFGGIGIFSGIMISLLFFVKFQHIQYILISTLIVFIVGIIDDLLSLSPLRKIFGQILAILLIIYFAELTIQSMYGVWGFLILPSYVSTPFTIFTVIVIINAYNLIDGVDGLAAGIGILSAITFGALSFFTQDYDMVLVSIALSASLLAFLRFNLNPAKIFMGDTGSLVVGLILAVLAINVINKGFRFEEIIFPNKGPLLAIGILAIPLFDSLRVFITRVIKGRNPLFADRSHFHHALLDLGYSHKQTAYIIYLGFLINIALTYFLLDININYSISLLAIFNFCLLTIPFIILKRRK
ncbi:MAG: MraY family glycosyltransferase [Bacteroidota bacterium]|nr:MraY family glycosyltransferase [Bacteroidota bacterium]